MIALIVIGIMVCIAGVGGYQIYLDTNDRKKKSKCPCGGNCGCNE